MWFFHVPQVVFFFLFLGFSLFTSLLPSLFLLSSHSLFLPNSFFWADMLFTLLLCVCMCNQEWIGIPIKVLVANPPLSSLRCLCKKTRTAMQCLFVPLCSWVWRQYRKGKLPSSKYHGMLWELSSCLCCLRFCMILV